MMLLRLMNAITRTPFRGSQQRRILNLTRPTTITKRNHSLLPFVRVVDSQNKRLLPSFPMLGSSTCIRWHGGPAVPSDAPTVTITFLQPDGTTKTPVQARVGETLLQTAHRNDIDLEGACEGVCACSTCHLIFPADVYDKLPEPDMLEEDMLDLAFGLTETSRLGCQITVTEDMDGILLEMPKATRNFYVDGHKPKPH